MQSVESRPVTPRFSLASRVRSFTYAGRGVLFVLHTQHNAWLHLVATCAVVAAALALQVGASDWRWLLFAIGIVWGAELFNTAIEQVCDLVSPGPDDRVKAAKDVAAGAVLISAIAAAGIGFLTFWPYLADVPTPASVITESRSR
jgi:diacylglycerol kinase (ATP)